jgi:hypothetical protein
MRQFKLDLIENDEYHKIIDILSGNACDLNIAEHIGTMIKNEVAEKF